MDRIEYCTGTHECGCAPCADDYQRQAEEDGTTPDSF